MHLSNIKGTKQANKLKFIKGTKLQANNGRSPAWLTFDPEAYLTGYPLDLVASSALLSPSSFT